MKWFLVICLLFAVTNIVNSRPNKDKDPVYDDDDVLNDDDGYGNFDDGEEADEDGDGEDEEPSDPPVIKTEALIIKASVGDTVDLPCETENAESYSVMWKQNTVMIFQDKIQVGQRNDRYQRFINQTLHIKQVEPADQGVYECSISTSPEFIAVKHQLIVLSPPKIVRATANQRASATIERGHSLELECSATGNPTPKVSWSKNGHRVSSENVEYGTSRISKTNVGREDAGIYFCMADNEQKEPTLQSVNVEITHKPYMKMDRVIVGETEMHLICKVHATPAANVTWTRDNKPIKANENILLDHAKQNHEHIVKILKVDKSYFGNYTCHAKNKFGHTENHVIVSGTPTTPKFENHQFVGDNNELKTKWTIMSMTPIRMIQLQYRKRGDSDQVWHTEKAETSESKGFTHDIEHTLKHLGDGVYEARLRAENEYGWSDYSKPISLEGKPSADTIREDLTGENVKEPESATGAGTRTIISWTSVLLVIMLNMYSSFV